MRRSAPATTALRPTSRPPRRPRPADLRAGAVRALEGAVTPVGRALSARRGGEAASIVHNPRLDVPASIELTSDAFADGEQIPDRCCGLGIGDSVSPQLAWSQIPEGTRRLLLVLEDIDFPSTRRTGIHAAAVLLPDGPTGSIAEGEISGRSSRFTLLAGYDGRRGYHGPRPLPGHGQHRYDMHLFALGVPISPPPGSDLSALVRALPPGGVLARGALRGIKES